VPTTPLPETRPQQPPSVSASPVPRPQRPPAAAPSPSALLQPPQPVQPPPDGPKFTVHQKVLAPRDNSEKKYVGWVVTIIFGHNGAPPTYRIRFSKQKEVDFETQETFAEAVMEAHPEPGLAPSYTLLLYAPVIRQ